jgi:hypothetical protein
MFVAAAMTSALVAAGAATLVLTPRAPPAVRAIDVELSPREHRAEKSGTRHRETRNPRGRVTLHRPRPAASAFALVPRRQEPPPPLPVRPSPRVPSAPPAQAPAGDEGEADYAADDDGGEDGDDGGDDD